MNYDTIRVEFTNLETYLRRLFTALHLQEEDVDTMTDIYLETTKRGVGHHDIHNLPQRVEAILAGKVNVAPRFCKLSSFGGMERWDGDFGLGEVINHFSMQRAITLANEHGIGLCTVKNSNHYLCSAPYVTQAAKEGCIGLIIAKGVPTMGVPGTKGTVIGQSPIGFAFPQDKEWPVMLDICLAYASGEQLVQRAKQGVPIPPWWGVDREGNPTTDAAALLQGVKYPIGEHKGFGLALLCELLTGVLSGGQILDEDEHEKGMGARSTSHTAIAIRTDALMDAETYRRRSGELIKRLRGRSKGIHIPGEGSRENSQRLENEGAVELEASLVCKLNGYADDLQINRLTR
jgi:LDH2 family malate/lactate/ureidoglycolate dehydrogenase